MWFVEIDENSITSILLHKMEIWKKVLLVLECSRVISKRNWWTYLVMCSRNAIENQKGKNWTFVKILITAMDHGPWLVWFLKIQKKSIISILLYKMEIWKKVLLELECSRVISKRNWWTYLVVCSRESISIFSLLIFNCVSRAHHQICSPVSFWNNPGALEF